jgi:hypothetical protein
MFNWARPHVPGYCFERVWAAFACPASGKGTPNWPKTALAFGRGRVGASKARRQVLPRKLN